MRVSRVLERMSFIVYCSLFNSERSKLSVRRPAVDGRWSKESTSTIVAIWPIRNPHIQRTTLRASHLSRVATYNTLYSVQNTATEWSAKNKSTQLDLVFKAPFHSVLFISCFLAFYFVLSAWADRGDRRLVLVQSLSNYTPHHSPRANGQGRFDIL